MHMWYSNSSKINQLRRTGPHHVHPRPTRPASNSYPFNIFRRNRPIARPPADQCACSIPCSGRPFRVAESLYSSLTLSCPDLRGVHSFATPNRRTSAFFSIASALFCENTGMASRAFRQFSPVDSRPPKSFTCNTYRRSPRLAVFWPKLSLRNSFGCNTYRLRAHNSFIRNTYKKHGEGAGQSISHAPPLPSRATEHRPRLTFPRTVSALPPGGPQSTPTRDTGRATAPALPPCRL